MAELSPLELDVAQLIVDMAHLDDIEAKEIEPDTPLFGSGLGLNSIDALDITSAISRKYGFQLRFDEPNSTRVFASLRALSQHIEQNRAL